MKVSPALKKNLLLAFVSLCIVFLIAEICLRVAGIKPGLHVQTQWFDEVDSIYLKEGFFADSNGIFKVSPGCRYDIIAKVNAAHNTNTTPSYNEDTEVPEMYSLAQEVVAFKHEKEPSTFGRYIQLLCKSKALDELDSAILDYSYLYPVNEDGFRSIPFKQFNSTKKKILLIGDSFTWGHSSKPMTNSFADLLLAKGYIVYNTGISGSDPAQYLAVAQQYIEVLKPDYVIVSFFLGNDVLINVKDNHIRYFKREVVPNIPIHYATNAGNILSCPGGIYFNTPTEAYDFVIQQYRIPQTTFTNRLLSFTAFGTMVWRALNRFNLVSNKNKYDWYWEKAGLLVTDKPPCNKEMAQIDSLCGLNDSRFILVTINDIQNSAMSSPDKFPYLFEDMKFYQSPVNTAGYSTKDGHYNNEGHKQYANFLDSLMRSAGVIDKKQ